MNIKPIMKFSPEELRAPSAEYNITYMWFWSVAISRELIDRELAEYARAGVKSLYIVPMPKDFGPETIRTYLDPEYLSPAFFDLVEYTLRKCVKMGMMPWIYDEGGWPSGGACYNTVRANPKAKMKLIEAETVKLESDKRFYPDENAEKHFVALFDEKRRLPDDYIPNRSVTLTAYYVHERIMRGCRVDYTNASVTDTFIGNTYEKYKERVGDLFEENIPVFFTDEPGLLRDSVADREFELFEQEYGYDLRNYAYVLVDQGARISTEEEMRARIDHFRLMGKLMKENTFVRLRDWCEKNRMYYSGHLDIDNRPWGGMVKGVFSMVEALRCFHIPGVDVIWEQIRWPYGGRAPTDEETRGMGFFPRLASSAARQTCRNLAVSESLGIYGDGLTPDYIRFVMNYQYVRGINCSNFAPISVGNSRMAALTTRPNFRPEKPGFYNLKHIHEYYAALSYLARLGRVEGDTALYMPCADYCAGPEMLDRASVSFKALGTELEEACIHFDIIDDAGIMEGEMTEDGLKLGDAVYRHIAVPECKFMPDEVKAKIAHLIGKGEPTYRFNNKFLRVMTRKLDTGRLWFIFNEGEDCVCEKLDIADGRKVYRIDPAQREMYREDTPTCRLSCGEMAVYLVTDEEYEVESTEVKWECEVCGFAPFAHRRFVFDHFGLHNEYGDGSVVGEKDFSGEISYAAEYSLPEEPKADGRYRIRLENFAVSAEIKLGDVSHTCGMTPMQVIVKGSELARRGRIEIAVANTALNELNAKKHIMRDFPLAEQGTPYMSKLEVFEKNPPEMKFGRVFIEKLG